VIHDLANDTPLSLAEVDLCIIGSGPAGMTLARELCGAGFTIAVLESGRRQPTGRGDALRVVQSEGITIKDYSRERVFGGSSTAWSGLSAPLDDIDLESRPWLRFSGWPLSREQLLPYWNAAAERYNFAPLDQYGEAGFGMVKEQGDVCPTWQTLQEKIFLARAEAQDFAVDHGEVFDTPGVDLYLDATVQRLCNDGASDRASDGLSDRVQRALIRTGAGQELTLGAKIFVLATGGLENPRMLLSSTDLCAAGLGNENDQVGRYLMNHPKNYHGIVHLAKPARELPWLFGCLVGDFAGYAGLRLPDSVQRERGLVNAYVRFEPLFPWSDCEGVEALVFLVKRSTTVGGLMTKRSRGGKVVTLRDYSETGDDSDLQNERKHGLDYVRLVFTVLAHLPSVARYAVARVVDRKAPKVTRLRLRNFLEMEPDPENRVVLGTDLDPDGRPITVVQHGPTDLDKRSIAAVHEALAADLAASGFGTLQGALVGDEDPWPVQEDASHHMGTTRMGDDPATSVVRPDGRLHSVKNVYVAGSSVFPTSGCANPTLTLVALSIRLAEELARCLRQGEPQASPQDSGGELL
jgi:choline dehydrogenase-like flavoprotein